jgi:hypothetical protein
MRQSAAPTKQCARVRVAGWGGGQAGEKFGQTRGRRGPPLSLWLPRSTIYDTPRNDCRIRHARSLAQDIPLAVPSRLCRVGLGGRNSREFAALSMLAKSFFSGSSARRDHVETTSRATMTASPLIEMKTPPPPLLISSESSLFFSASMRSRHSRNENDINIT